MNLRQENENVMDTLVRTKVELAETQGALSHKKCKLLFQAEIFAQTQA